MRKGTENPIAHEMKELAALIAELKEEEALQRISDCLAAHIPPVDILSACQAGMRLVGSLYEERHYYMAGLILAGEIMNQAVDLLKPVMIKEQRGESGGRVVLGTIRGDIHDIGKNLFRDLLECHGITVLDLGVDVNPADFVKAEAEFKPCLVAASALITASFPHLRELVKMFQNHAERKSQRRPFILIGGGQIDERVFRASGADHWAQDAFSGIHICRRILSEFGIQTL